MPEGYFKGRKAKQPSKVEIGLAAFRMSNAAEQLASFCVQRKFNDYGVARFVPGANHPVQINLRQPGAFEEYSSFEEAAAAGWELD